MFSYIFHAAYILFKKTLKEFVQDYRDIRRKLSSDSESDDDFDFPEIEESELIEKIKKADAESRISLNSKFREDTEKYVFVRHLSCNRIQPSETHKREFIEEEYSSDSKRVKLHIPSTSNAKRTHEDDLKSNSERPNKKYRDDPPQNESHDFFTNGSIDETKPVKAMLKDVYDSFMNYSYEGTPQHESKDISPEECFLNFEECLNKYLTFRMEEQENADSDESDISEGENDDFSPKKQPSINFDYEEFAAGIFADT
ncbi:hypothetical protein TNCT_458101 [Trichonephila clavata]|uniref:Uncharacterized protein n=1 Tax=Trichonephila clavata TaxID=2740835 RepID=A0A8X6FUC3_TRICU|nr:hypothetical protein TNCT_458101 [Trichonephila clavata]